MEQFNNENQNPDVENVNDEVVEEAPAKNPVKEVLDWVISIAVAVILALVIRNYVFVLVKVDGQSMVPTLHHGEYLYTNRFFYTPANGDIVIFTPPNNPDVKYVKRVIATAGQTVAVDGQNHTVTVDGKVLDEPYINEAMNSAGNMEYPCTVPEGYIFVLGDNRNHSKDSRDRSVGLVPVENVTGEATLRLWPLSEFGKID